MKLSKHSQQRIKERADIEYKNQKNFYRSALDKGKSAGTLKDSDLKKCLLKIERKGCKAKYYKGYIFIHSKNNKTLYTMYKYSDN